MDEQSVHMEARNKEILELRIQGLTLKAIGLRYGVTRERIRVVVRKFGKRDLRLTAGRGDWERYQKVCNLVYSNPGFRWVSEQYEIDQERYGNAASSYSDGL